MRTESTSMIMIFLHWRSIRKRKRWLYKLYSKFLLNLNFTTIERFKIMRILQAQIDRVRLMTVRVDIECESLTQKWNNVWHFTDNSFVMQNENIKTDDKNTSAEIESIMSEINTADTQLNTSCSTKESKTHHFSNSNTIVKSLNRLCSFSITSFANHERWSIHANSCNERRSVINDFISTIVIRSLEIKQHQSSDDLAEIKKQKWEITKILEKRAIESETKYRVRWKDTWLLSSKLRSAQRLLKKFETKDRAQHERKRDRLTRMNKDWWSCICS